MENLKQDIQKFEALPEGLDKDFARIDLVSAIIKEGFLELLSVDLELAKEFCK